MNIEYANAIPLRNIFVKLGIKPQNTTETQLYYISPFHEEKEPTLVVDTQTNQWTDTRDNTTGDVIALVMRHLKHSDESYTVIDALRWVKNMVGYAILSQPKHLTVPELSGRDLKYKDHQHFSTPALIRYVEKERGIPFEYARFRLLEIKVLNKRNGNTFIALGIKNEDGGYAVENQYLKTEIGRGYISFIRGQIVKPDGIHVFKDVFDYLSALTNRQGKPFDDDVMILNSLTNMQVSAGFIRGYGYTKAYTWFDNTTIGNEATRNYAAFFRTEPDLVHKPMNKIYDGHTSINSWLVAQQNN